MSKGLKFCPTPGYHEVSEVQSDLDHFHRQLRFKHFFHYREEDNPTGSQSWGGPSSMRVDLSEGFNHPKLRYKSTWQPKGPQALEAFAFNNDCQLLRQTDFRRPRDNLSPDERSALKQLKNLENVTIKPADKGSAVVLQNTSDYITEGFRQLNAPKFYLEQITDLSETHMESIKSVCSGMLRNGEISEKCFKYFTQFPMRTSRFYMLPKIHKGTFPPPGRPIISGNDCPSERISSFVDFFLKEISPKGKSYLKDTTNFIRTLNDLGTIPDGAILATLDVSSLYTNIPNGEGIRSMGKVLEAFRPNGQKPTNTLLLRLLTLVLRTNNFTFCGKHFLQVGGTAMGTKAAPNYAINYMHCWEKKFVYGKSGGLYLWKRYIDDIFLI